MIAVGVLLPFGALDNGVDAWMRATFGISTGLLLSGTIFALLFAYVVRFLALSFNSVEAGLGRITPSMDGAARTLGQGPLGVLRRVHLPLVRGSLLTGALLVFVDTLKELPATLIVRPFNFDTLAVRVYLLASDERLAEAATAALTIVAVGIVPVDRAEPGDCPLAAGPDDRSRGMNPPPTIAASLRDARVRRSRPHRERESLCWNVRGSRSARRSRSKVGGGGAGRRGKLVVRSASGVVVQAAGGDQAAEARMVRSEQRQRRARVRRLKAVASSAHSAWTCARPRRRKRRAACCSLRMPKAGSGKVVRRR